MNYKHLSLVHASRLNGGTPRTALAPLVPLVPFIRISIRIAIDVGCTRSFNTAPHSKDENPLLIFRRYSVIKCYIR